MLFLLLEMTWQPPTQLNHLLLYKVFPYLAQWYNFYLAHTWVFTHITNLFLLLEGQLREAEMIIYLSLHTPVFSIGPIIKCLPNQEHLLMLHFGKDPVFAMANRTLWFIQRLGVV